MCLSLNQACKRWKDHISQRHQVCMLLLSANVTKVDEKNWTVHDLTGKYPNTNKGRIGPQ